MSERRITRRGVLGAGLLIGAAACGGSDRDTDADRPSPSADPTSSDNAVISVLCPAAWGAAPAQGSPVAHTIERLTVHHTAVSLPDSSEAPGQLRAIQLDHQRNNWTDIAYHYLIDVDGNLYAGRDPDTVGDTYTSYDPTGHLLVCMLGHYDRQPLTRAARDSLVATLAWGAGHYGVGADTIAGHNDYEPTTSCPGRHLTSIIHDGSLAASVDDLLGKGEPTLRSVCGAQGLRRVTAIEAAG